MELKLEKSNYSYNNFSGVLPNLGLESKFGVGDFVGKEELWDYV